MKMTLYGSRTSPFSRKVMIAVEELNLASLVERVMVDPFQPTPELLAANPLAQIPALVTEKGDTLPGSDLIIEYLQTRGHGLTSLPRGSQRWAALRRAALAEGLLEAAVAVRYEALRPAERQHAPFVERKVTAIWRSLDALEASADQLLADGPSVVEIGVGAALGYLDFRFAALDWRQGRVALAHWYAGFAERPSMLKTRPVEG